MVQRTTVRYIWAHWLYWWPRVYCGLLLLNMLLYAAFDYAFLFSGAITEYVTGRALVVIALHMAIVPIWLERPKRFPTRNEIEKGYY